MVDRTPQPDEPKAAPEKERLPTSWTAVWVYGIVGMVILGCAALTTEDGWLDTAIGTYVGSVATVVVAKFKGKKRK